MPLAAGASPEDRHDPLRRFWSTDEWTRIAAGAIVREQTSKRSPGYDARVEGTDSHLVGYAGECHFADMRGWQWPDPATSVGNGRVDFHCAQLGAVDVKGLTWRHYYQLTRTVLIFKKCVPRTDTFVFVGVDVENQETMLLGQLSRHAVAKCSRHGDYHHVPLDVIRRAA